MTMEAGNEYKKGLWTEEEDRILMDYITLHGEGKWNRVSQLTGLQRGGKSCRLRWINYLRPTVKRGGFSEEEDDLIIRLHKLLGNRWSLIAGRVPGRTDNQVKNHWNTHLSKKLGVKKEKNKVSASVHKQSKGLRKNFNTPLDSYSKQASGCNGGATDPKAIQEKEIEDGLKSVVEFTSTQEPVMVSDGFNSTVRFSNDEFNLYTPNLECLLDDYSLDFVWNNL